MTYRATRGGRAARRKAQKDAARARDVQAGVRDWLERHPPRAEVPMALGKFRVDPLREDDGYLQHEVTLEQAPRPKHPVVYVPIAPSFVFRALADPPVTSLAGRGIQFKSVPWACTVGGTTVYWWNWEPLIPGYDEAQAEMFRATDVVLRMMRRLEPTIRSIARYDNGKAFAHHLNFIDPDTYVAWWRETMAALEAWQGRFRTRYTLPAAEHRKQEERVTA